MTNRPRPQSRLVAYRFLFTPGFYKLICKPKGLQIFEKQPDERITIVVREDEDKNDMDLYGPNAIIRTIQEAKDEGLLKKQHADEKIEIKIFGHGAEVENNYDPPGNLTPADSVSSGKTGTFKKMVDKKESGTSAGNSQGDGSEHSGLRHGSAESPRRLRGKRKPRIRRPRLRGKT